MEIDNLTDTLHALRTQAEADLEIAARAAPGPWFNDAGNREIESHNPLIHRHSVASVAPDDRLDVHGVFTEWSDDLDTPDFIAHSRAALPASAAAVIRLVRALQDCVEHYEFKYADRFTEEWARPGYRDRLADIRAALEGEN